MSRIDFTIKDFAETDVEYPGSFSLILSDATLDRDNEIVETRCFSASRALPARISMDIDHELKVLSTVGSGVPSYTVDGSLHIEGTWAATAKAQETRALVRDGHIMFASAAFRTLKSVTDKKGVRHVTDAELLNGTFTQIPANPSARVLTAKDVVPANWNPTFTSASHMNITSSANFVTGEHGPEIVTLPPATLLKVGARNSQTDQTNIQSAHDLMVAAGASCDGLKSLIKIMRHVDDKKSIVGSVEALQARVQDALEDTYPSADEWSAIFLRGVIPSGDGGTVIFMAYGFDGFESDESYSQTFSDDGAVVTLTGDPVIVDIAEIVMPDADAATEDAAAKSAAAAIAAAAAEVAAADSLHVRIRVIAARALVIANA